MKAHARGLASRYAAYLQVSKAGAEADIRRQQRVYDAFVAYLTKVQGLFPGHDLRSAAFWARLDTAARQVLATKAMQGPGVDW